MCVWSWGSNVQECDKYLELHYSYLRLDAKLQNTSKWFIFQSPRNGDDLSDGEPLETEERSHTPPPRVDSPEDNLAPQLKVKVGRLKSL